MRRSHWALVVFVATAVCSGNCRPSQVRNVYPVYRSVKEVKVDAGSSSSPSTTEAAAPVQSHSENAGNNSAKLNIESIATVARASSDGPSLPSSAAIGHVLDAVSQMVESDIRTPPKLKEIMRERTNEQRKEPPAEHSTPLPYTFIYDDEVAKPETTDRTLGSSEGKASHAQVPKDEGVKGIAIPVVMDDDYEPTSPPKKLQKIPEVPKPVKDEEKKNSVTKSQPTTTPSSGLSTWILLSDNKDFTTPSPKKNAGKKEEEKKKGAATTTKKPAKIQATTQKSAVTQSSKKATKKPETEATAMSALEALVKNQKKGAATTSKPKPPEDQKTKKPPTDPKKKFTDRMEVAESKDKVYTLPPNLHIATTEDKPLTSPTSAHTHPHTTTDTPPDSTTTKKSSTKKKKKNKNRRKKPAETTAVEAKIPPQPVGSQIYNFLSREIVPTVGLGLIGVALTAGLASFLGYNPFGSSTIPLRRTYDTHHGYSPNTYYNYNTDYGGGGQSEELLFREVLSGMPDDTTYDPTRTDSTYPQPYNPQHHYNPDKDITSYDPTYPHDYSTGYALSYHTNDKYPLYTRDTPTAFVYPDTTGITSPDNTSALPDDHPTQTDKYPNPHTIERHPEALYRVAPDPDLHYRNADTTVQGVTTHNTWHRMGSPMDPNNPYPVLEPGPRSLHLTTLPKNRTRRAADSVIQRISRKRTNKANDAENEVDFDPLADDKSDDAPTPTAPAAAPPPETTPSPDPEVSSPPSTTTGEAKEPTPTESTDTYDGADSDSAAPHPGGVSVLDVLKRLAQFKLRLGLNFLRSTTDMFSRYLEDIQRRVDESFANTTTTTTVQYNKRKSPWSRIFFSRLSNDDSDDAYRRKRSLLEENQFLSAMLTDESKDGLSKSTKKDLRLSAKNFYQKQQTPKKYEPHRPN